VLSYGRKGGMAMLTEFGKVLRKLRIDNQELLKDMAARLRVSSAYLSAVETGKRKIPPEWISTIEHEYKLDKDAALELESAYEQSASELKISLANATGMQKEVAISFAKALNGLDEKKLKKILDVMDKRR
jgi:transcriptional regulator with XRE-family HTH domain